MKAISISVRINEEPAMISKADEISALKHLTEALPAGLYLSDLFSQRLLNWAEYQIGSDFAPDIMSALDSACQETNAQAKLTKAERDQVSALKTELEGERRLRDEMSRDNDRLVKRYSDSATHYAEAYRSEITAHAEALSRASAAEIKSREQTAEIASLQRQITVLKSRLFDAIDGTNGQTNAAACDQLEALRSFISHEMSETQTDLDNAESYESNWYRGKLNGLSQVAEKLGIEEK